MPASYIFDAVEIEDVSPRGEIDCTSVIVREAHKAPGVRITAVSDEFGKVYLEIDELDG
jgi:hypothetical protein